MTDQAAERTGNLDGSFLNSPPGFFTLGFHFRFVPRVIAFRIAQYRRMRNQRRHFLIEIPLLIFGSLFVLMVSLPGAIDSHSVLGIAGSVIGAGVLLTLIGYSIYREYVIRKEEGYRYDYAVFVPTVFFFFLLFGFTLGLAIGAIESNAAVMQLLWGLGGALVCYVPALFAARWINALGFMADWFRYLMVMGLAVMLIWIAAIIWVFA